MTMVISFHHMRFRDVKTSYLASVLGHLQRECLQAVSYQRVVELMPSTLGPLCAAFQTCLGACTGLSFVDATALAVCHHRRIPRRCVFRDLAQRGKTSLEMLHIEQTRHRSPTNVAMSLVAGLIADCHQPNKPSIDRSGRPQHTVAIPN